MKDSTFHTHDLLTPAYVYDQDSIVNVLDKLVSLKEKTACLPLYSVKSANMIGLLEVIKHYVSGFSCSSLFEAKLAAEVLDEGQTIHITTPGYRNDEWDSIIQLCDFVTLNSTNQWQGVAKKIDAGASCGIRLNPELSFVNDERYDPCRPDSKLGMTFEQLAVANSKQELNWKSIEGVHIHNNCESTNYDELKMSTEKVMAGLSGFNPKLKWVNLGGGYLLNDKTDLTALEDTIKWLQDKFDVDVYIEPGKAITRGAGYLVSTVIDLIESKNKIIAVLDTTINHLPEVFEYQYQPKVMNTSDNGKYEYRLVGCSCLSGDLFGDYYFDKQIEIGSRVVFGNIGAYMQVKANMFNGINLPATYLLGREENLELIKQNDYESFRSRL
ncbi:MAG: carboxynorspermidine decarboxylase [Gammaproteobacteria bacterium]|jgi:carboxynorspermidine decarboxylase